MSINTSSSAQVSQPRLGQNRRLQQSTSIEQGLMSIDSVFDVMTRTARPT